MSISTLHVTPVTQMQRGRSTVLTSIELILFIMGVIIAVNIAIIKHANYILHCGCLTSNGFILLLPAALSSFSLFLHFLPSFFVCLPFSFLCIPQIIFCHSLAALALSAAPHPLVGLWKNIRGRTRARETLYDSVWCVNYNKINFKLWTAATVLLCVYTCI